MLIHEYLLESGEIMKKLIPILQNIGIITVEDVKRSTTLELLTMIIYRLNELIGGYDYIKDYLLELLDKGLQEEIINQLNKWVEDGTMDKLINQTALKTVNDRIDGVIESHRQLGLNPKEFGAKGDGVTDDLNAFNDMIAYGKANGIKQIILPTGDYFLSSTLWIPTGWELRGNGRSKIIQSSTNLPVIGTEEWNLGKSPTGYTKIKDVLIAGNENIGDGNHGVLLFDYYATIERVYVNGVGGHGIYMTAKDKNDSKPSGNMVENTVVDCHVRRCGLYGYYLGEKDNNKLTDGILQNCMCSSLEGKAYGVYVGSSAGWFIDNIHTYGRPDRAMSIQNAFYTTVSNIYIEDFITGAMALNIQNTLTLNNISISLRKTIQDGVEVIRLTRTDIGAGDSNLTINNLNLVTGAFTSKVTGLKIDTASTYVSVSNYNVVGNSIDKVTKIGGEKGKLNYLENYQVVKQIAESKFNLTHNNKKLKVCDIAKFNGNGVVNQKFKLEDIGDYGKILCDVTIIGNQYDDGGIRARYTGKIMISAKTGTTAWRVVEVQTSTPTGFTVEPSFTANKTTGELTVNFTATDSSNTGVICLDWVAI